MNRFQLLQDEKIILENPKHWRNYIVPIAALCFCLGGLALRVSEPQMNLVNRLRPGTLSPTIVMTISYLEAVTMVILACVVSLTMVDLAYTRYYVTNKRVINVSGWINVRTSDMLLERVETVSLSQRFSERIFNSGDVLCISAGASLYLDDVYDARAFRQRIIEELANKVEDKL